MKKKKTLQIEKPSQPTDPEYIKMFDDCVIDATKTDTLDKTIDDQINANKSKYVAISNLVANTTLLTPASSFSEFDSTSPVTSSQIPWYFIACIHYMECNFDFNKHLHNGDPLTGYTVHVPANRPKVGHAPPFTFEESAGDALKLMKLDQVSNWNLPTILRKLEAYNGFGYYKYHNINSPYLWSYSNQYTKGKYVADGKFDANAVSKQMGAAVILKRMEQRVLIYIPRQ